MVPTLLAVVEATVVARLMRAPSIYSARISSAAGSISSSGDEEPALVSALICLPP
jgi:hypothetical protein